MAVVMAMVFLFGSWSAAQAVCPLNGVTPLDGGIEAAGEIKREYPDVKVLILSMHKDKEYLYQAILAGAEGYVLKENMFKELFPAIETIREGNVYFPLFP